MKKQILHYIRLFDLLLFKISGKLITYNNYLLVLAFHGVFRNENERALNLVDSQSWITIDDFDMIVEYYLNHDYLFVSPDDILKGLNTNAKYILITFDDGYFNNKNILPILKKYKIPAIFSVSMNHIKDNKAYWWDVLYREGNGMGLSSNEITVLKGRLKQQKSETCEQYLKNLFGEDIFRPIGDIDRPFSLQELKDFSKEKLVFIGNHTSNHNILTNYCISEIKSNISSAQDNIYNLTGEYPKVIVYPNGYYSEEIITISKDIGFKLGFSNRFKKTSLPIDYSNDSNMSLGRYDFFGYYDKKDLLLRCEIFRSKVAFSDFILNL